MYLTGSTYARCSLRSTGLVVARRHFCLLKCLMHSFLILQLSNKLSHLEVERFPLFLYQKTIREHVLEKKQYHQTSVSFKFT